MTDEPQIGQTADSGFSTVALADWKVIAVTANSTPVLWPWINSLVWPVGAKFVMAIIKFVNKDEAFAHNGTCMIQCSHRVCIFCDICQWMEYRHLRQWWKDRTLTGSTEGLPSLNPTWHLLTHFMALTKHCSRNLSDCKYQNIKILGIGTKALQIR